MPPRAKEVDPQTQAPPTEAQAIDEAEKLLLNDAGKPMGESPYEQAQAGVAEAELGEVHAMAEMLTGLLMAGFAILASKRGEHWALTEEEAAMIAAPGAELLAEAGFTTSTPEVRFMIAAGAVLIPKWYVDRKLAKGNSAQPVDHEEV